MYATTTTWPPYIHSLGQINSPPSPSQIHAPHPWKCFKHMEYMYVCIRSFYMEYTSYVRTYKWSVICIGKHIMYKILILCSHHPHSHLNEFSKYRTDWGQNALLIVLFPSSTPHYQFLMGTAGDFNVIHTCVYIPWTYTTHHQGILFQRSFFVHTWKCTSTSSTWPPISISCWHNFYQHSLKSTNTSRHLTLTE